MPDRRPRRSEALMPDATGLELLAQELGDAALDTVYFRDRATLAIDPAQIRAVLGTLREQGLRVPGERARRRPLPRGAAPGRRLRAARHGPRRPRHGQAARPPRRARGRLGRPPDWPTADHQEREVYDMFGVVFRRPPRPAPDPDARGLRGPPAAPRLPDRRRTGDLHARRGANGWRRASDARRAARRSRSTAGASRASRCRRWTSRSTERRPRTPRRSC